MLRPAGRLMLQPCSRAWPPRSTLLYTLRSRRDVTRCDVRRRHGDTRTHVFHAKRSAGALMSIRRFFDDYTPVNRMHHSKRPFFLENLTVCFASALDPFGVSSTRQLEDIGLVYSAAYKFA